MLQLPDGTDGAALTAGPTTPARLLYQRTGKTEFIDITDDPNDIVREFRTRFFDTRLFFDKYAGGKFAMYLFRRHDAVSQPATAESARQLIEEAQLFLEASHACQAHLTAQRSQSDLPTSSPQ